MQYRGGVKQDVVTEVDGRRLKISSLDRVVYPETGTTKGEVLNYYARIAPVLLPHLADRALTRIRWPHGTAGDRFFEKNLPSGAPDWLRSVTVPSTGSRGGSGDTITYPIVDGLAALTYLANLSSLELHVHQWTVGKNGRPKNPNRLVIDLDPGAPADLHECCQVALLVRERLDELGLRSAPVTSGSKGLHLYAALPGKKSSDEVRDLAKEIAQQLAREHDMVLWKMTKSLRGGKVLLDWSQNTGAKTTITPYSLRGRSAPYVAAPRTWEEVEQGAKGRGGLEQCTMDEVLARVDAGGDVFGDALGTD